MIWEVCFMEVSNMEIGLVGLAKLAPVTLIPFDPQLNAM
jgi:hypothetical protein